MCGGSNSDVTKQNSKANSTQTYTPAGAGFFNTSLQAAQNAANLPYKPITQGVAGFTPEQNTGIGTINNAYSMSQPYITNAANLFGQAAHPLTASDINQYYNPYASAVGANMAETFGQQQRDTTGKLTGAAGGIGADRIAVGQAELARQQGLAAGQTYASIYQNALQAAQNQQGIEQASGYGYGNLGASTFQEQLAQGAAQLGAGTQQQQTEQERLNALYNQQQAQAAYPFQVAQWQAGLTGNLAGQLGGTTAGKQTGQQTINPPNPSPWSQAAGLGIAALGAFAKRGGRIQGYAVGGSPYEGAGSYIPDSSMPPMAHNQQPQLSYLPMSSPGNGSNGVGYGGVGGKGSNVQAGQGARNLWDKFSGGSQASPGGWSASVSPTMGGFGNMLSHIFSKRGGGIHEQEPYKILTGIARGKGGEVNGYAFGGGPGLASDYAPSPFWESLWTGQPVKDQSRFGHGPLAPSAIPGLSSVAEQPTGKLYTDRFQDGSPEATTPYPSGMGFAPTQMTQSDSSPMLLGPVPGDKPIPGAGTLTTDPNGPIVTKPTTGEQTDPHELGGTPPPMDGRPPSGMAPPDSYSPESGNGAGPSGSINDLIARYAGPPYQQPSLFGHKLSNMNLALMSAGLGMMGGTSPYAAANIGEGGLKGVAALKEFQQLDADRQAKALQATIDAQRLGIEQGNLDLSRSVRPNQILDALDRLHGMGSMDDETYTKRVNDLYSQYPELTGGRPEAPDSAPHASPDTLNDHQPSVPETPFGDVHAPKAFQPSGFQDRYQKEQVKEQSLKELNGQDDMVKKSQQAGLLLAQMRGDASKLSNDSFLAMGPGNSWRTGFAKLANTMNMMMGVPIDKLPFPPDQVASLEQLYKDTTNLGYSTAATMGSREAAMIIQQAIGANPGAENTPLGFRILLNGIQAGIDREVDYRRFLNEWSHNNKGDATQAYDTYSKVRGPDYWAKKANIMATAQDMVANGKATQEQAAALLKKKGIDPSEVF